MSPVADAPTLVDESFVALGTTVRIVIESPDAASLASRARWMVENYDRRLSRFRPDSELCALNADPSERVRASPLLRGAVKAALWAAERSGGLVDPTLLGELERAGYVESRAPRAERRGTDVPEHRAPRREWRPPATTPRPAEPRADARWRAIGVEGNEIVRPPGLRLDLGGSGKGHVADLIASILVKERRWAVDCGGDVRVGGVVAQEVVVAHPFGGEAARATLQRGAVATSSIHARSWPGGHHIIDPATGEPAWTGVVSATAFADSTLEAETLAKVALLSGTPDVLDQGHVVTADGKVVPR